MLRLRKDLISATRVLTAWVYSSLLVVLSAVSGFAAPGDLDPNFGTYGFVSTGFSQEGGEGEAYAIAIQSDGKIILAGSFYQATAARSSFALVRYNADGSLDMSFGSSGKVITNIGVNASATAVALQADGSILVGGSVYDGTSENFALVRYTAKGALDGTFGVGGIATLDFAGGNDIAYALTIQPDGEILLAGFAADGPTGRLALARYKPNGILDETFGSAGKVTQALRNCPQVSWCSDVAFAVASLPDGRIITAGTSTDQYNQSDFAVTRHYSDGTLDSSFGDSGTVITDVGNSSDDRVSALVIQTDGKILVAGYSRSSPFSSLFDFTVVRYNTNGSIDETFSGGKVLTAIQECNFASSVALQADGKVVLAGTTGCFSGNENFALIRYNQDGSLDQSFGQNGAVVTDASHRDGIETVAIQADGDIVVGGYSFLDQQTGTGFAAARYKIGVDLIIRKSGTGSGSVDGIGISCGADCTETQEIGATNLLRAIPLSGSKFVGWSGGGCAGIGDCAVVLTADQTVTATFEPVFPRMLVTAVPKGEVGALYSVDLPVGGGAPPYVFTIKKGKLPAGLSLTNTMITGTPLKRGDFPFEIQVKDQLGNTIERKFRLVIKPQLLIKDSPLKVAAAGKKYSSSIRIGGGRSPFSWAMISGGLPPGFVFNTGTGAISGTTIYPGTYNFTVKLVDSLGGSLQKSFALVVSPTKAYPSTPPPGGGGVIITTDGISMGN